jgi:hypothetical protein
MGRLEPDDVKVVVYVTVVAIALALAAYLLGPAL